MTTTEQKGLGALLAEQAPRRVRYPGAAIGHGRQFVEWASRLFGPEILTVRDLPAAIEVLRDEPAELVLVYLPDLEFHPRRAFEVLTVELPGTPLVAVAGSTRSLGFDEQLELQVVGMTGWIGLDASDEAATRMLTALASRRDALRTDVERHKRAMRQLVQYENWSARSTKRLDEWVHELRTPLAVIRGFAANLSDHVYDALTDKQESAIQRIASAEEILRGLVEQIRDDLPAPPELDEDLRPQRTGGRTQLQLEEICDEVADFLKPAAESVGATLTVDKAACPLIWGNRMRLIQALVNLVKNACRFTPRGGTIEISVRPCEQTEQNPWPRCEVSVSDTGPGIDEQAREKIFEPGWTTDAGAGHQGMGLSVVSEVVREHGATLELATEAGRGTTFRIVLPVDPRRRRRRTTVRVLRDAGFALDLMCELRGAENDVRVVEGQQQLDELRRQVSSGGHEILVLDPEGRLSIDADECNQDETRNDAQRED